jgi:hypothetical protein
MRPMFLSFAISLCVVALPAYGETRLNGEAFDRYTQGRTLTFSFMGEPYGVEEYRPGRRVVWAFIGQECREGVWFEREGDICFIYDHAPDDLQCWAFYETGQGLLGVFQGPDGPSTELYEIENSAKPLQCPGPDVGV